MFNWIKNLIKNNHTLILKQEWLVDGHEFKKPIKKKKKKAKKKTKKKKKKDPYAGPWNGRI